jgi:hypothetical protein
LAAPVRGNICRPKTGFRLWYSTRIFGCENQKYSNTNTKPRVWSHEKVRHFFPICATDKISKFKLQKSLFFEFFRFAKHVIILGKLFKSSSETGFRENSIDLSESGLRSVSSILNRKIEKFAKRNTFYSARPLHWHQPTDNQNPFRWQQQLSIKTTRLSRKITYVPQILTRSRNRMILSDSGMLFSPNTIHTERWHGGLHIRNPKNDEKINC